MDSQRSQLNPAPKPSLSRLIWIAITTVGVSLAGIYGLLHTHEEYEVDFEDGNREHYRKLCWTFSSTATNTSNTIDGTSIRTGQLTNTTNPHTLGSPCTAFDGTGSVSFTHKVTTLNGSSLKQLDVVVVDDNGSIADTILTHEYTHVNDINSTVYFAQDGQYTLEWRWIGIGGTGRGVIDNITVNGEDISDPDNACSCGGILPVRFLSFSARQTTEDQVRLDWRTAHESQNKGFEIERSDKGKRFETIGFVEGIGTSQTATNYQFVDETISHTKAFYRLRQIDLDGKVSYSQIVEWTYNPTATFRMKSYPNPVHETLFVAPVSSYQHPLTFTLLTPKGQLIWTAKDIQFDKALEIPVKAYPAGAYTLQVSTASTGLIFSKQVFIQH